MPAQSVGFRMFSDDADSLTSSINEPCILIVQPCWFRKNVSDTYTIESQGW